MSDKQSQVSDLVHEFLTSEIGSDTLKQAHKVNISNSFADKWQIDVWFQSYLDNSQIPTNKIKFSFFMRYDPEANTLTNLTKSVPCCS